MPAPDIPPSLKPDISQAIDDAIAAEDGVVHVRVTRQSKSYKIYAKHDYENDVFTVRVIRRG